MKIKKTLLKIGVAVILAMIVLPVFYVAAAGDYTVLAPLPGTTVDVCDGNPNNPNCQTTLERYLPGLFNLAIGIAAVAAVLMIVIGGFQYISSDALTGKSQGKQRIQNAVFGLILVIGAYLILYTINPKLLELHLEIETITTLAPAGTGGQLSTPGTPMTQAQIAASDAIRVSLAKEGIFVYASPCTQGQTTGCVNLNGLTSTTLDGLTVLKTSCPACNITITGGTESGHSAGSSHNSGIAVDLRMDASLNNYITTNKTAGPTQSSYGPIYTLSINGRDVTFLQESSPTHWHVTFK